MEQERLTGDLEQRLRSVAHARAQPGAEAAGKDADRGQGGGGHGCTAARMGAKGGDAA